MKSDTSKLDIQSIIQNFWAVNELINFGKILTNFAVLCQSHPESMADLLLADDRYHPKPLFFEEFISFYRSKKVQLHAKGGHIT
jgi:hypothetical protein